MKRVILTLAIFLGASSVLAQRYWSEELLVKEEIVKQELGFTLGREEGELWKRLFSPALNGLSPRVEEELRILKEVLGFAALDAFGKGNRAARENGRPTPKAWRAGIPIWQGGGYWGTGLHLLAFASGIKYGFKSDNLSHRLRYIGAYFLLYHLWEHPLYWLFIPGGAIPQTEWRGKCLPFSLRQGRFYPEDPSGRNNDSPWMNQSYLGAPLSRLFGKGTNQEGTYLSLAFSLVAAYYILPEEKAQSRQKEVNHFIKLSPVLFHDLEGSFAQGQGIYSTVVGNTRFGLEIKLWKFPSFTAYQDARGEPHLRFKSKPLTLIWDFKFRPWDKVTGFYTYFGLGL